MNIPSITYSNYFGKVSKVRWYKVTNYFGEYDVNLTIIPSQTNNSQVSIQNRQSTNGIEWSENIYRNVSQTPIPRQVSVLHVPSLKAVEYVVINQAT